MLARRVHIAIFLAIALALSSVHVPAVSAPTNLTVLVHDAMGEPMDLDPAWSYDTASAELLMNVYSTLLWFNRTNMDSYVPRIATNWTGLIVDFTTTSGMHIVNQWVFEIRDGVYFHSDGVNDIPGEGALLTTQDIEYTFERILLTDCATGPAWMIFEPLVGGYWMGDVNDTANALHPGAAVVGPDHYGDYYNVWCDNIIDEAVESNATHVWFNLIVTFEPWLQIVAQQWGSILNQAWCVWHGDWPGAIDDSWVTYHDPVTSPLYSSDPSSGSGTPNLDAALGTGPYMLDYWDKGLGNAWSVVKNSAYWAGWAVPYDPVGWGTGFTILDHFDRYTSNYIPEWNTRKFRFLGGLSDICTVRKEYMGEVLGWPGIDMVWPLPQLSCSATFFNFLVNDSSKHIGNMQPNSTFDESGAPPNMFNDSDTRLGFAHLFDYATYLETAYLNESVSPVTPILPASSYTPGLSYYDSSIGKAEEPAINQRKQYGIASELANALAYNLTMAASYLSKAWNHQLWGTGFTIDLVYPEGNTAKQTVAQLVQDGLETINTLYGTKFNTTVVSILSNAYKQEIEARTLPYFIEEWAADYADAHNSAYPFMHSAGTFSKWQGYLGLTTFPNAQIDGLVEDGISTLDPAERQGNYTLIQQSYVDQCPGWVLSQPIGRYWERDWVEGWYYNPIYPGNYAYDIWKTLPTCTSLLACTGTPFETMCIIQGDVAIANITDISLIEIGLPIGENVITMLPGLQAHIVRLDTDVVIPNIRVVIGLGVKDVVTGREIILAIDDTWLGVAGGGADTYIAIFDSLDPDPDYSLQPGNYTVFVHVLPANGYIDDVNLTNNKMYGGTVETEILFCDINVDGTVELLDFFVASLAFGSYPGHPRWEIRVDLNQDNYVELTDFFTLSQHFGEHL